ncbi:hypothetical protein CC1G_12430 [Coprinopsis cinerea okayama7|uniref:Uncharacterized protein n=1 Tax=Coprinopsis cinerea (strain Okayama-7 / 130 / ATCC MYA-4618 / FGSC 9003) TaxID=240176 RepID=A8P6H5_COPC7|nr:hypothetical protein CC1G_12430 [Coprinopsis cinerea okayama7\|eukprot:XP_001839158.1 hypothetical protein CC1G_12430 [Coprinopsis cinerea okayama7\
MATDSGSLAPPLALPGSSPFASTSSATPNSTAQGPSKAPQPEFGNVNSTTGAVAVSASPQPNQPPQALVQPPLEDDDMERDSSPEPATDADIAYMKKRLLEMGLTRDDGTKPVNDADHNSREGELLDMVLTLIRPPRISPSQLANQAEMIASLQAQNELWASQLQEERLRMESERDGFERMAEALIRQRNRPGVGIAPNEELVRKCSILEADNRILRERLQETYVRANALEAEVLKLKPLLLMPTFPATLTPSANTSSTTTKQPIGKGKKRKQGSEPMEDVQAEGEPTLTTTNLHPQTHLLASSLISTPLPQLRPAFPMPQPATTGPSMNPTPTQPQSMPTPTSAAELYRQPYPYLYPYYFTTPQPHPSPTTTTPTAPIAAATNAPAKAINPYLNYTIHNARIQAITTGAAPSSGLSSPAPSSSSSTPKPSKAPANSSATTIPLNGLGPTSTMKPRRRSALSQGLTADARTEHILLASRKIGRERAAYVAGILQNPDKGVKDRDQQQQSSSSAALDDGNASASRTGKDSNGDRVGGSRSGGGAAGTGAAPYFRSIASATQLQASGSGPSSQGGEASTSSARPRKGSTSANQHGGQQLHPYRQSTFVFVRPPGGPNSSANDQGPASRQQQHASSSSSLTTNSDQRCTNLGRDRAGSEAGGGGTNSQQPYRTPQQQPASLPNVVTPQQQHPQPHTKQTPLDSLVTAALGMQEGGASSNGNANGNANANTNGNGVVVKEKSGPGRRRKAADIEQAESPAPKRRKSAALASQKAGSSSGDGTAVGRTPSALDVLADQAQAAVPMANRRGGGKAGKGGSVNGKAGAGASASVGRRRSGRGKGKEKEAVQPEEEGEEEVEETEDVEMKDVEEEGEEEEEEQKEEQEEEKPVESVSVVVPKRRGRPPKAKKETATAKIKVASSRTTRSSPAINPKEKEETPSTVSGKRKRAPPRDRTIPLTASASVTASSSQAASTSTSSKAKGKKAVGDEVPVKRGRGRPSKASTASAGSKAKAAVPTAPSDGPRIIAPPPASDGNGGDNGNDDGDTVDPRPSPHPDTQSSPLHQLQPVEPDAGSEMDSREVVTDVVNVDADVLDADADESAAATHANDIDKDGSSFTAAVVGSKTAPTEANETDVVAGEDEDEGSRGDGSLSMQTEVEDVSGSDSSAKPSVELSVAEASIDLVGEDEGSTGVSRVDFIDMDVSPVVASVTGDVVPSSTQSVKEVVEAGQSSLSDNKATGVASSAVTAGHLPGPSMDCDASGVQDKEEEEVGNLIRMDIGSETPVKEDRHRPTSMAEKMPVPAQCDSTARPLRSSSPSQSGPTGGITNVPRVQNASAPAPSTSELIISSSHRSSNPADLSLNTSASEVVSTPNVGRDQLATPTHEDATYDSDMDAEAEDDDEDRDAEGEDEDMDGVEGTWPQISYSSTELSRSLAAIDSLGEDADAEGEIEDESDEPPEAVFRPSELIPGA